MIQESCDLLELPPDEFVSLHEKYRTAADLRLQRIGFEGEKRGAASGIGVT